MTILWMVACVAYGLGYPSFALGIAFVGATEVLSRYFEHSPSPTVRWLHWFRALLIELFATVFAFCLSPLRWRRRVLQTAGHDTPILFVHGYLHHGAVWFFHQWMCWKKNIGPTFSMSLGYPFSSIETYAVKLAKHAEAICAKTNHKELMIVGHSMGGLVACHYALHLAKRGSVKQVITIGTPLEGTLLARIAPGEDARQMQRNAPYLAQLQSDLAGPLPFDLCHISTSTDNIVIPPSSSAGSKKRKRLILNNIGHVSMLFSPRVFRQIQEWR
ncbi:MAG: hypothetical protein RL235_84 [Chlamydiota bacterium]|jgi:triacylglycerol lipase